MIDLFEFYDVVSDVFFLHQLINVIFQINNIILNLYLNQKKKKIHEGQGLSYSF